MYSPVYSSQMLKGGRAGYINRKQAEKEEFILIGVNGVDSSYRGFFEDVRSTDSPRFRNSNDFLLAFHV